MGDISGRYFDVQGNRVPGAKTELADYQHQAEKLGFENRMLRVLRSGEAVVSVDEAVDAAGKDVWMSVTKMPLRDDNGEVVGLVSTTHAIANAESGCLSGRPTRNAGTTVLH